ncbi:MAG TPA: hypothetical protein VE196_03510 [Pseudonocardiaceae bacterium]|nr:hypothetical protein [Pseudonocardiaceae bacterium]
MTCRTLPHYSNPNLLVDGVPVGLGAHYTKIRRDGYNTPVMTGVLLPDGGWPGFPCLDTSRAHRHLSGAVVTVSDQL